MEKKYKIVSWTPSNKKVTPCICCPLWVECNIRSASELSYDTLNLINECRRETTQTIVEDVNYENKYILTPASKSWTCRACHLIDDCEEVNNPFFAKCKAAMRDGNPLMPVRIK